MLFLVISTPAPTRPSDVREQKNWPWVQDELDRGIASSFYPRTGRVDGVGKNQLDKLLMQVREEYRL